MKRTSALKWIVSTVLCLALVFALLPTAVFAETGTAEVGTWDEFTTALADSSVNTITLTGNIASPQESGDLALVIGSSDRAVTITGGQITVKNAGIILGGDVTFQNIELYFANSVRNAILANGHSLTLDTVTNTSEFDISLFCGGVTDYCGSNISEIPATGTDGHITIKGTNSLGNIYAGSLSDVVDDAADSPNEYTGNATVTIVSGASGMGGIYAHGAREDRSGGNYNVMLNASAKYMVSGGVTINLSNATTTVDGATGGSSNAVVNYVAANGNEAVHTLKNIGALTLSGTTPNLAPATNSTIDTNASVTVPNGARLDLTNFTNTTAADNLTIGSLAGGGTLVLGSDQMLTITDTVTGETGVAIGGVGYDGNSTTSFSEDTVYITTGAEIDGSFTALSDGYALENVNGSWTAVVTEVSETSPVSFTISQEDCELTISEMDGGITVEAICKKQNDADLLTDIPLTIAISKDGADAVTAVREYNPAVGYLYSPVHGIVISTLEEDNVLYIFFYTDDEAVPVAAGEYTITIAAPLASGETANAAFALTVIEDPVDTYAVVIAETTNGTITADKAEAAAGETVTLTVTPAVGYALSALTVTDAGSDAVTVTGNAFTMPASAVAVTAVFSPCTHIGGTATCTTLAVCDNCGASYGELDASNHASTPTNGFYDCCGKYQPAVLNNGIYEISNVGQLYWFAQQVNGGNTAINGKLTADIVVNPGTFAADGSYLPQSGEAVRPWTPIGSDTAAYNGTFDGGSHTVSGLFFNDNSAGHAGLFGFVNGGAVQNVGVVNSYICGGSSVGGVVGEVSTGSVTNCHNTGAVSGSSNVGGVMGYALLNPAINCYFLQTNETNHGLNGIGNHASSGDAAPMSEEQFTSGEVCYRLNGDQTTITFKQTIGTEATPNFTGDKVYYGYLSCAPDAEMVYTNTSVTAEKPAHSFTSATGKCEVCGSDMPVVATVTIDGVTTYCEDLPAAFAAAQAGSNAVITLLSSADLGDTCVEITFGIFTLDLNGCTISGTHKDGVLLMSGGDVTITDSGEGGAISGSNVSYYGEIGAEIFRGAVTVLGGSFELKKGSIENTHESRGVGLTAIGTTTSVSVTVTGGTIEAVSRSMHVREGAELTVTGGTITGEQDGVAVLKNAKINITGGTIVCNGTSEYNAAVNLFTNSTATIEGGSITGAGIGVRVDSSTLTINGGTISGARDGVYHRYSSLTINGGTITGATNDLKVESGSTGTITLSLADGKTEGATFPGGITVKNTTLSAILGEGVSYWGVVDGKDTMLTVADDAISITDKGDITIRATCTHSGADYTANGDGTHSWSCDACGKVEMANEAHTLTYSASGNVITASCDKECGFIATITLVAPENLTYDGNAKTVTISGSIDGVTLPEIQYTGNRTDAGKHTATLTLGTATATLEFTITKADAAVTAPEAKTGLIYSGSAQALVTAGSTQHGTVQYSLDNASWSAEIPTATNAREYTVYYKVVGDENHNDTDPASVTVTIGQMDLSGAAVTLGTALTYNGTVQTQTVASVTLNGLTLTAGDYTITGNQQTDAGDYTLTITGKGNFTGTATAAWSIAKASMTITADNVTVLVGKDVPAEAALTYTVTGLVNGETADDALTKKPALSYAETPDTTQEGSYTINISGAEAANYTITYVTGTLTVSEKIPVTITVNIPTDLVYDGTDLTSRVTADITASAAGEEVTVAGYDYTFSASPINAGSYTLTVSVVDSDEQYVGSVNVSFTIAKRSLTLKADNKSVYVNDSEPEYTFTVTGLVTGHSLSGAVADCADADMTKAGTYDITISTTALVIKNGETDVTANYAVTTEKGTLTVREYSLPVIPTPTPTPTPTPDPEPEETVTVPVTNEDNTVEVEVTVTEGKATVEDVDLENLEKVVDGDSNTVTMDFSELDEKITEVELPREVVEKIAETAGESEQTLEIVLSDGVSIEFNAPALNEQVQQTGGISLTVSIVSHEDAKLTREQKTAVGDRPAYDISVTSDGKNISNMGGKIALHAPYELRNGEKPGGLVVYYVDDHGKRERCETHYDARNKRLSWQTDHLSLYMLDYDEKRVEACDGGENCPINAFTDTDSKAWYHNGVHCCIENDLMNGISDDLFAPNGTTTRAQIVTILWRLDGKPVVNYLMQFEDVASESWYTEAVRWAASENIVGGYGNGKFGPNDPITRQQMVAILYRYCQYTGLDVSVGEDTNILSYTDAFSISKWAIPAMQWACGSGMIQGIADGDGMKLDPSGSATRAQIATILWRFCDTIMDN